MTNLPPPFTSRSCAGLVPTPQHHQTFNPLCLPLFNRLSAPASITNCSSCQDACRYDQYCFWFSFAGTPLSYYTNTGVCGTFLWAQVSVLAVARVGSSV